MASSPSRPSLLGRLTQPVFSGAAYLRDKLGSLATGPAIAVAKPAILSLLSSIEVGTLILIDEPHGERHVFGQPLDANGTIVPDGRSDSKTTMSNGNGNVNGSGNVNGNVNGKVNGNGINNPIATLTITSPSFYPRLLLLADMGFAQSYLLAEVTSTDLTSFFRLFLLNRDRLHNGTTALSALLSTLALRLNTTENALLNASAHYDLGNAMFAAFLSPDMTYSCPIWTLNNPDPTKDEELERAQMRKLHRFIAGARLKRTDHVLELGTGWGSFAVEAAKRTGCRVTTVTLSRAQKEWAEERVEREGLGGRVRVLLMDYRDVTFPVPDDDGEGQGEGYDKIVSIEMLEAVGKEFLGTYFGRVHRLLKRDGGLAMFQCITMPEGRHAAYEGREDFINRYIFPGGYLPSVTQLLNHITAESGGTLIVEKVENIGGHYARALRLWRERFLANFEDKIRPALMTEHPGMREEEVEVFRRKWEYYFSYSEAGFLTKTLGDVIITHRNPRVLNAGVLPRLDVDAQNLLCQHPQRGFRPIAVLFKPRELGRVPDHLARMVQLENPQVVLDVLGDLALRFVERPRCRHVLGRNAADVGPPVDDPLPRLHEGIVDLLPVEVDHADPRQRVAVPALPDPDHLAVDGHILADLDVGG
ncbi:Tuberculostearic acid methyltransferase UfaA1 [Parachaetomium inaequale]|uniref:Tuberculostearic acid methyltransferase UfaA1 n=1 Tax=Parachaetomium inaequale TaxID=2588326 RepID=A0AAN6P8J8_9PEZI|nr:Tuberculostearic acid methyltransferase UfaA1 [Parachaetomium inaequale]